MTLLTYALNGVPVETYGLVVTEASGLLAAPVASYRPSTAVQVVGRPGNRTSAYGVTWTPRTFKLTVQSLTGSQTTARALAGALFAALQGALEIEAADAPGRVCTGWYESAGTDTLAALSVAFTSGGWIELPGAIVCSDPYWYDRAPQLVSAAASTPVALPIGTAGGRYEYRIVGSGTSPTLTLSDRTGTMVDQMRFTVTLGSGDTLVIKPDTRPAVLGVLTAGVLTAAWSDLNSGDTFLHPDPLDGPIVATSAGTLLATCWRGYLV